MAEQPKGLSPQRLAARKRSAISEQANKGLGLDLNFLLKCSNRELGALELARLAAAADLRSLMQETLDRYNETIAGCMLLNWFRNISRDDLRRALETEPDPIAVAKKRIKELGQSQDELQEKLDYALSFVPGAAHRTAAVTYQKRNIEAGLCSVCPESLAANSVRYCEKHLAACRERARAKSKKFNKPPHGRAPGTLAALEKHRERKTVDEKTESRSK